MEKKESPEKSLSLNSDFITHKSDFKNSQFGVYISQFWLYNTQIWFKKLPIWSFSQFLLYKWKRSHLLLLAVTSFHTLC